MWVRLGCVQATAWAEWGTSSSAARARMKRERCWRGHRSGPRCKAVRYAELGRTHEIGEGKGKRAANGPRPEGHVEKEKQERAGFGCWARKERERKKL